MDLSRFRLATSKQAGVGIFSAQVGFSNLTRAGSGIRVSSNESSQDNAVEVALSKKAKKLGSAEDVSAEISKAAPQSGIRSLLSEIKARTDQIKELNELKEDLAPGSDRFAQLEKEIAGQEQALGGIFQSSSYGRIRDLVSNVQQILSQGGDRRALLGALQGDAALLGSDFLARVGNGESANIALFGGYLSTLEKAVGAGGSRDQGFFNLVDSAVSGALRALDGPRLGATPIAANDSKEQSLVAPLPQLEQLEFAGAGELAIGIRGYLGADALQAALANIDYDPKQALVLLSDKPEDAEESRRQKEKEDKEDKERRSASLRTDSQ